MYAASTRAALAPAASAAAAAAAWLAALAWGVACHVARRWWRHAALLTAAHCVLSFVV
jgi:hypothetical protein